MAKFDGSKPGPGRPKGSRNKLGIGFIAALIDDFEANGAAAIERMRLSDPAAYVRIVASLLPREVKDDSTIHLSDEQLDARIRQLVVALGVASY